MSVEKFLAGFGFGMTSATVFVFSGILECSVDTADGTADGTDAGAGSSADFVR